jgi:anti-sigma regulatory factor (Ser/Thr protein kinase)/DNA-binding transcriptional regulator YhcF (GntR family)
MSDRLRNIIQRELSAEGEVRTSGLARRTGVSRAYVHRVLQQMEHEGTLRLIGRANQARYVRADKESLKKALATQLVFHDVLTNQGIEEDRVFSRIKAETGILQGAPENVARIVEYGFTEMLNNAIEHSRSAAIDVRMTRSDSGILFTILDRGIGIFQNIMRTRRLRSEQEALQDLLKGKQTTMPERHSGEGIFFTSRVGDSLTIRSSDKKVLFDNLIPDVFIRTVRHMVGTRVDFRISLGSPRKLLEVFREYSGEQMAFDRTRVSIALYSADTGYVSRSQARRLLSGLESFREIVLDFAGVRLVGQAFADEVLRVWKSHHPEVTIRVENASPDVRAMLGHVDPSYLGG